MTWTKDNKLKEQTECDVELNLETKLQGHLIFLRNP